MPLLHVEGHRRAGLGGDEGRGVAGIQFVEPIQKLAVGGDVAPELVHVPIPVLLIPQPELDLRLDIGAFTDPAVIPFCAGKLAAVGEPGAAAVPFGGLDQNGVESQIRGPGGCAGPNTACAHHQHLTAQLHRVMGRGNRFRLRGLDEIQTASVYTGAAFDALVLVDLIEAVLDIDGGRRTFQFAVVTADAAFFDVISHNIPSFGSSLSRTERGDKHYFPFFCFSFRIFGKSS